MNKIFLIILFFFIGWQSISAQQITGFIVDPDHKDTLSQVMIYNQSKDLSTLSDEQGYFQILAHEGDTIHFFNDGHYPKQILVRNHHFWDHLHMQLTRHTVLLDSDKLMRDQLRLIANKFKKPIVIAGLPNNQGRRATNVRSSINIISESEFMADIKKAYQLNDEQLEELITLFYEQQKDILKNKDDQVIITSFLLYVDTKTQQKH
ncbi:MAG: hypothetical protein ACOCXH_15745 [Cyclobacteriaceae bacterium]